MFTRIFIDPGTRKLRGLWRVVVFLLLSPLALNVLGAASQEGASSQFKIDAGMILNYAFLVAWSLAASWICLRFLDQLSFASLGVAFHRGWWREALLGLAVSALMIGVVVILQEVGGGMRLMLNPLFWKAAGNGRTVDAVGLGMVAARMLPVTLLLVLAGAFEELLFRGYAFQTLAREVSPVVPLLLFSVFFGVMHWENPSRTFFSTVNTVLAGVWLAVAYLKTRALWFPIGLHIGWNWTMGVGFGLPVSGFKMTPSPVLMATSGSPTWLTGGDYGSEGGAAATLVLIAATLLIWRAGWLRAAPAAGRAQGAPEADPEAALKLGLKQTD